MVPASRISARALLEAALQLDYLVRDDQDRRARAYWIAEAHRTLRSLPQHDPATQQGKQRSAMLQREGLASQIGIVPVEKIQRSRKEAEAIINDPAFLAIQEEYQRVAALPRMRGPPWYSLFNDSVRNVAALARSLNRETQYDFYRAFSSDAHAAGVFHGKLSASPDGALEIHQLGWPGDAHMLVTLVGSLSVDAMRRYLEFWLPDRIPEFVTWYATFRERHFSLPQISTR